MNVTLVMVQTLNGKITRADESDITSWTSKEDHDFFVGMLEQHDLIVMGSGTFEAARNVIKPDGKKRRIILTSDPSRYAKDALPKEIEFTSESPTELVSRLEKEGYKTMLLVGGGETNRLFFERNLVTEMYITIEPRLFGEGKPVVSEGNYEVLLKLKDWKQLNSQGTLLLHYTS